jgi:lipid-A-disaccharide synthase
VRILISAGEASGEFYGAQLMQALRHRDPSIEFFGVGGDRMRAAGCDTLIDTRDLSVVGITEILGHLPKIYSLFGRLIAEADKRKPDVAVVIDSPAFNWRVARQMHKRGIPVVYYVCPQFWAWRQGRVKLLRKYVDKGLVIFPFEEKFYRDRGVDATFVGHPLAELPAPSILREDYAAQYKVDPAKYWITLMPGSRRKEVRMNLPTMLDAAAQLGGEYEFLLPVAPTLDRQFVDGMIRVEAQRPGSFGRGARPTASTSAPLGLHGDENFPKAEGVTVSDRHPRVTLVPESLPALWHSRAGIIASGTATVEAAMMSVPYVMVYRVSALTYLLGRRRIKVPHFAMVNLIAGERVVPELVQDDFTAANILKDLRKILPEGEARHEMLGKLAQVKTRLRSPNAGQDTRHPSERAADQILGLVGRSDA